MTFPASALGINVQLNIGGTWTDVSSDVRGDGASAVAIQRGITSSGGSVADRGSCDLVLDNRTGKYSSRNPRSPYFGLIGRNTGIRVGVAYGTPWLDVPYGQATAATTPDSAGLSITGDIDVRVDAELAVWGDGVTSASTTATLGTVVLGGKWANAAAEWWLLVTNTGCLQFSWTADGSTVLSATSAALYAPPGERLSVRATLDVNNGSGGWTVTFYTSTTAGTAGPWTQLGNPVTGTGTTSIFNGTAALAAGEITGLGYGQRARKIYAMQVRSGIAGTVVANPDFTAQAVGATSFTDSAGAVWTVPASGVSNVFRRFTGRVSSWPPQWTTGGFDVTTPITATGRLQQLGQGRRPLPSTLGRFLPVQPAIIGYWPCEDGANATQAAAGLPGVAPMTLSGFQFAQATSLPGSNALPVSGTSASWSAPVVGAPAGIFRVEMMINIPQALTANQTLFTVHTTGGTYTDWGIILQTDKNVSMNASVPGGTSENFAILSAGGDNNVMTGNWQRVTFMARTNANGHDIDFGIGFSNDVGNIGWYSEALDKFLNENIGTITSISGSYGSAIQGTAIGHIAAYTTWDDSVLINTRPEAAGQAGETAGARVARVCDESSIPVSVAGADAGTEQLGAQPAGTLLAVVQDATTADEGLLAEALEFDGIRFRTRASLYSQPSALDLPYTASPQPLVAPLVPTDDDQRIINDSTVTRTGGSSGRYVETTGTLNVQDPPNGVGLYDENVTLNLYEDSQTQQHAGWRVHIGTWDEARFPQVNLVLENAPALIPAISRIDTGARIRITGTLPDWLPPDSIDLLVLGYQESLAQFAWHISYACVPYGPYLVGLLGDSSYGRLDTAGSQLALAAASTDTALTVETTSGPYWTTDPAEYPLDLRLGGETVTATACANGITDSFGRTLSNGWGTATSGQAWTTNGGAASDYSTNGSAGLHSLTSVNVTRACLIGASLADFDVVTSFSTSALAVGASQLVFLMGRWVDANNFLSVRAELNTSAGIVLTIRNRIAGVDTSLTAKTTALTHVAGTLYRLRFSVVGSSYRARIWLASAKEPAYWDVMVTDSSITAAGQVGVRTVLGSGNTNTLPVTVTVDDFALLNPQVFTVTRATNGIAVAHAAAADVRLAHPMILAL
ncbi:MAG: hypothetical protein HOY79_43095 [Streptomyces sp.]|nr:hypothetical protein [Streptomyces sp.]